MYDCEEAPDAQLSGVGPCIQHWGVEVDDIQAAAETITQLGGEVMSPLDAGVVKFRAPDGTIAELVQTDRYENLKRYHGVA